MTAKYWLGAIAAVALMLPGCRELRNAEISDKCQHAGYWKGGPAFKKCFRKELAKDLQADRRLAAANFTHGARVSYVSQSGFASAPPP